VLNFAVRLICTDIGGEYVAFIIMVDPDDQGSSSCEVSVNTLSNHIASYSRRQSSSGYDYKNWARFIIA
jgi:hypothetical protein